MGIESSNDKSFQNKEESNSRKDLGKNYVDISAMTLTRQISEHTKNVNSMCFTKDGRLATCSDDKTIKVFNLNNYKCDLNITGHKSCILDVSSLDNGCLITSSEGGAIKVWEITKKTFNCVKTLTNHEGLVVQTIQLARNRMASCSFDLTIRIWISNNPYTCVKILKGHKRWVNSLLELRDKNYIVSGSDDHTLRFWNSYTYECEKIIFGIGCEVRNSIVEIGGNKLIVGGGVMSVINLSTFQIEADIDFINDFGYVFSAIRLKGENVLFGSKNGKVVLIETTEYRTIGESDYIHDSTIRKMLLYKNQIITCSDDKTIKFWKIE